MNMPALKPVFAVCANVQMLIVGLSLLGFFTLFR